MKAVVKHIVQSFCLSVYQLNMKSGKMIPVFNFDSICSETNTLISSVSFFLFCSHESNMQHRLSISPSIKIEKNNMEAFFSHEIIYNVVFEQLFSRPSQDAAAASETASSPLLALMETLNIDAVIIQGHVDTRAYVCKIVLSFDVN